MTPSQPGPPSPLHGADAALTVLLPDGEVRRFERPFRIGRDPDCDIRLDDPQVSRRHATVAVVSGVWVIRDLQSSNGLFIDDRRVERATVADTLMIRLGRGGPVLLMSIERGELEEPADPSETVILRNVADRYFKRDDDEEAGAHTIMIRQAFKKVQAAQRRRYRAIVLILALVALAIGAYALRQHQQLAAMKREASNRFYRLKRLEVQAAAPSPAQGPNQTAQLMLERRRLEKEYDDYVRTLYPQGLTQQQLLILRVTRAFGECDVTAPTDYLKTVEDYIGGWKSSGRFVAAVRRAQQLGYTERIAKAFIDRELPPQFFYLALQESDFEPYVTGKPTKWGFAKGMWQFIPDTGRRYGLRIGPLQGSAAHDPDDDRQDWRTSTDAAARYIKDLYSQKTQASGLLVMASYNWGEGRVLPLIETLADTPSERNFWQLSQRYRSKIPPETYNYVFSIVSAAAIGEDPRQFGFALDNPLLPYLGK